MLGEKKLKKIYVVRDEDVEHHKYISKILVVYKDDSKYYSLPSFKLKFFSKKREKLEKKMDERLKKILNGLDKADYQKIVFVSDDDDQLREQVDRKISELKKIPSQIMESIYQGSSILYLLSSFGFNSSIFSLMGTIYDVVAINGNLKRSEYSRDELQWLRKLKLASSMFLLSLNVASGSKNISVDLDRIQQSVANYTLQKEIDNVLENRELILDDLNNPFDGSNSMITSSDAMTNVLMETFDLNPLIQEEDREIASNLKHYIAENPYLDYERLYDDFSSFGIIDTNYINGNINGIKTDDYIIIFNSKNQTDEQRRQTVEHELVHRTGHLDCAMLNEGMTSLIVSEYMDNFLITNDYADEVLMTKVFCELITPEKMLEAYSKDDMNIIKNEFLKLNPNEDTYNQLIDLLDHFEYNHQEYADKGKSKLFSEEIASQYKDAFIQIISEYLYSDNADFSNEKIRAILEDLDFIGTCTNVQGIVYFNKNAKELSYENAYSSELTESSNYHY